MTPRGLTLQQAAEIAGLTPSGYRAWVAKGIVPGPWPGTRRIDAIALPEALDRLSGRKSLQSENLTAYDAWKSQNADAA